MEKKSKDSRPALMGGNQVSTAMYREDVLLA